jgi:hypothetical protein
MSAPDRQALLARNAELRAELAADFADMRTQIEPALQWVDQTRALAGWAREHASLLGTLGALAGALLLRRRRGPARGVTVVSTLPRLLNRLRIAFTVGTMLWRLVDQRRARP